MNPSDLRPLLDAAPEAHARHPRRFADELQALAGTLPADEAGAEAVRWAEHVMLGHLADADALQRFLKALPASTDAAAAWQEALARASWALAVLASLAPSATPSATNPVAHSAPSSVAAPAGNLAGDPGGSSAAVLAGNPAGGSAGGSAGNLAGNPDGISASSSASSFASKSAGSSAVMGSAPPSGSGLSDAARWRALQNVVLALAWSGRTTQASAWLVRDEAAAAAHADPDARRAYAACANNVAQGLREGLRGDPARDALMLQAAALARRAWTTAGTWLHAERADYQLARCHAVLGRGTEALHCARACHAACVDHGADADERFFAHEALWHAHRARGDEAAATAEHAHMQSLLADIADAEMRACCARALAELAAVAAPRS
jgi:hypothetical protein